MKHRSERLSMLKALIDTHGAEKIRTELGVKQHTFSIYLKYPDERLPRFADLRRIELRLTHVP